MRKIWFSFLSVLCQNFKGRADLSRYLKRFMMESLLTVFFCFNYEYEYVAARHYAVIWKQFFISIDRNRGLGWVDLGLSQDEARTDLFENLNSFLKGDLSIGTTFNQTLFSYPFSFDTFHLLLFNCVHYHNGYLHYLLLYSMCLSEKYVFLRF